MLQAIAENEALLDKPSLLSSAESKRINVHSAEVDLVQSVRNSVARIERFWRKSEARSEKGHSGLGLAVVAACAERLGARCRATLQNCLLRIEIRWNG